MKKIFFILLLISGAHFVAQANEGSVKNAGFVPSNIWYSKTPFFADENIRIYTILFNGSSYDLDGTVEFLDEATGAPKIIGKTDFSISGGGRIRDVWIDWKATEGKHIITARIAKSNISLADGTKQVAIMENVETGKSEVLTDLDTDGDKIGNATDIDDDNDGVTDANEKQNGTNSLKSDSNGNGISDKKEAEDLAKKIADNKKDDFEKIENIFKATTDIIPEPIKNATMAMVNTAESFRSGYGDKIRIVKENKLREIKKFKENPNTLNVGKQKNVSKKSDGAIGNAFPAAPKKPFVYAEMAMLAALQYFFDWKLVFYGVDFYILYRLIFLIARKSFHKK